MADPATSAEKTCSICLQDDIRVFKLPCCSAELCNGCLCRSTVDQVSHPQCSFCHKNMTAARNALVIQYSLTVCSHDGWRYEPSMMGCSNPECADFRTSVFSGGKRSHKGVQKRFHEIVTVKDLRTEPQFGDGVVVVFDKKCIFGYGSGVTVPVDTFFLHATGEVSAVDQNQVVPHSRNTPVWAPLIPSIQCATIPLVRPHL